MRSAVEGTGSEGTTIGGAKRSARAVALHARRGSSAQRRADQEMGKRADMAMTARQVQLGDAVGFAQQFATVEHSTPIARSPTSMIGGIDESVRAPATAAARRRR